MNKIDLLEELSRFLKSYDITNHKIESQMMIAFAADQDLFTNVELTKINFDILENIANERIKGKPLSKITHQKGFWKHIFYTNENTMDPRADSEVIIENVLNDLSNTKKNNFFFIDLCCGTGCLGISLLDELSTSNCDFIDISKKALSVCKKNITKINVKNQASIFHSNLFNNYPLDRLLDADFIISNPPYIPFKKYLNLDNSTLHDPQISLEGGDDGLFYYIKIIEYLINVGYEGDVYFEVDPLIIENLMKFLLENSLKISYKKQDYLKLDRLLKLTFPKIN